MAKKDDKKAKQPRRAGGSKGGQSLVWTLMLMGSLMAISLPTVILVFFGMMPTLVAAIVDRSKGKAATFCVGGMNFCGVFPWLLEMWFGHHSISAALGYLTDPFILLIMFGSSAFGWVMFTAIPPVVISILTVTSQHKVAGLRDEQKKMIQEWGAEVANLHKEQAVAAGGKQAKTQSAAKPPSTLPSAPQPTPSGQ